jgi:LTXXQ motif family protein
MRAILLTAALGAALLSACQGQPVQPGAFRGTGWGMGPDLGPMMSYGYCPSSTGSANGSSQGWYGPGMMQGGMMGGGMMGRTGGPFDPQQTQAWLDQARTQIGVTAAQESAWAAYASAVAADRASMLQMHAQMPAMMSTQASAPDRLQAHLGLMSARLASLQQIEAATQALYQVLTPQQRQRADQTLWSGCW